MSSTTRTTRDPATTTGRAGSAALRVLGAVLALAVAYIHVKDQGGLTALKDPAYIGYGYWLLEIGAVVCAVLLLLARFEGWLLAVLVALGPIVGFVLTRSTGLPSATDDIGNWGETLGVVSLVVEGVLLLLALSRLAAGRRRA